MGMVHRAGGGVRYQSWGLIWRDEAYSNNRAESAAPCCENIQLWSSIQTHSYGLLDYLKSSWRDQQQCVYFCALSYSLEIQTALKRLIRSQSSRAFGNLLHCCKGGRKGRAQQRACPYATPYAKLHTDADVLLDVGCTVYFLFDIVTK